MKNKTKRTTNLKKSHKRISTERWRKCPSTRPKANSNKSTPLNPRTNPSPCTTSNSRPSWASSTTPTCKPNSHKTLFRIKISLLSSKNSSSPNAHSSRVWPPTRSARNSRPKRGSSAKRKNNKWPKTNTLRTPSKEPEKITPARPTPWLVIGVIRKKIKSMPKISSSDIRWCDKPTYRQKKTRKRYSQKQIISIYLFVFTF